jgi:hypothetical protein
VEEDEGHVVAGHRRRDGAREARALFAMRADDEVYGEANREAMQGYGRMVNVDDRVLLFANPEAAAEHLGCDLRPVE